MHNYDTKCRRRLYLTLALLLSGVVCGAAAAGTKVTTHGIVLPETKTQNVQVASVDADDIDKQAVQAEPTSLVLTDLPDDISGDGSGSSGYRLVSSAIRDELRRGRPTYALKILAKDPMAQKLKNTEYDRVKAMVAQSYLVEGKIDRAAQVAGEAVKRSGKSIPLAAWVAGQAAWRSNDFAKAMNMFGICAISEKSSPWLAAGGAYWASRAALRIGDDDAAEKWLEKAAQHPRTFYGFVSLRVLDRRFDFNWDAPSVSRKDKRALSEDLKVSAALRLSREGKLSAAITTLSSTAWMRNDEKREALLAYVMERNDPALSLYIGKKTRDGDGRFFDAALYPESPWEPESGYEVDKALIHALIRQESRFNHAAVSKNGARGLMQLLPSTASYMSSGNNVPLSNPQRNIEVGQKYVKYLLGDKVVNNDLFKMAVAYNAGPGNLSKWKNALKDIDDPLLFIESIPSGETRAFVERVMVNYWVYRERMGQDSPSLDAIASLDRDVNVRVASNAPVNTDMFALAQ